MLSPRGYGGMRAEGKAGRGGTYYSRFYVKITRLELARERYLTNAA
jgi:hypothetical protein